MKLFLSIIIGLFSLSSCSSQQKMSKDISMRSDSTETQIVSPSFYQEKFIRGIDFYARGNEPNWTLEIDLEKGISFSEMNGLNIVTTVVEGIMRGDADLTNLIAHSEDSEISVTITKLKCQDNMSGEMFDYTVQVKIKKGDDPKSEEFIGCGRYLYDYRLNDIWVMEEMTGVELKKENLMQGLPMFEFHLAEKRFNGHAGCNQIFGEIVLCGDKITFSNIASTKMACPEMTVEQKVLHSLNQNIFTYKIEEMKLTLESESGLKMVFRKAD
ncbi:MAG: META domain-containing protein [Ignavibacterium album]|uniref:META domain-containing protein n=1 Tax=Ignavibacterium album TaxID=591197 RepID=UPI0026EE5335|nr:META domain-containing protein [Ignavibacterium album]MBI5662262.1 META domain-containing protein [Ignavibacterium album]